MFIGKGSEMIVVLRNNKNMRRKKVPYSELRKRFIHTSLKFDTEKEKSNERLKAKIRKDIRRQNYRDDIKRIIILIISVLITVFISYKVVSYFSNL